MDNLDFNFKKGVEYALKTAVTAAEKAKDIEWKKIVKTEKLKSFVSGSLFGAGVVTVRSAIKRIKTAKLEEIDEAIDAATVKNFNSVETEFEEVEETEEA